MSSAEDAPQPEHDMDDSKAKVPRFFSQLKKAHKGRIIPELKEEDLEESFVRGAGCSVSVSYVLLMRIILGNRQRPRWAVREQDGEQRTAAA